MSAISEVLLILEKPEVSQFELKRASKLINAVKRERFAKSEHRYALCDGVRQYLTLDEIERLFGLVTSKRDALSYALMLAFGLRVSEVYECEYHEPTRQLLVLSEKTGRYETLPVYPSAERIVEASVSLSGSITGLRNRFRKYRDLDPELTYRYSRTRDGRKMSQFSSKSLRKSAIERVYEVTKDPIMTSRFSRHSLPYHYGELASYLHRDETRLREVLEEAIGPCLQRIEPYIF